MKSIVTSTLLTLFAAASAHAVVISGVTKENGNDSHSESLGTPNLDVTALDVELLFRNDRSHVLIDTPVNFSPSAQNVQLSNSDKSSDAVIHNITVAEAGYLMIGIDNRQFDNGGGMTLQATQYSWMADTDFTGLSGGFTSTDQIIGVDENNNGSANQYFTIFEVQAEPGTYKFGAHEGGGNNMYAVFSDTKSLSQAIPEPSAVAFLALGLLGFAARRKR